jgi:Meckel syndrome type 1 protein
MVVAPAPAALAPRPLPPAPAPARSESPVRAQASSMQSSSVQASSVPAGSALADTAAPALPVAVGLGGAVPPTPLSRRPLIAADGGDGMPFMKAGLLDCVYPLWSDHEPVSIESKRVCGCRVVTGKRWCAQHYAVVFEPMKKPLRAA